MSTAPSAKPAPLRTMNIVISGTNFWNPGDDFVRDGVIRVLRELFPDVALNFLFYNFNADFFPQSKFTGIANYVSRGDLDQFRDSVDAVVIAGLSAGDEIKDLYRWVIENGLQDRVYLIGAGYENDYVAQHVSKEPEATIFKCARIITGRTAKTPEFLRQPGTPYVHVNCPAILSVPEVKDIPSGRKIERIGFSIQLPHGQGLVNHSCAAKQSKLAADVLLELSRRFTVEVFAHHKTEYFHFLKALRGTSIPVLFSSFYQGLFDIYPRYDLVITTRLHSSLFANGHGIPGIIINDTDRHTHTLDGFSHSVWVNTRQKFDEAFARIQQQDLAAIAKEAEAFKRSLLRRYVEVLAGPFREVRGEKSEGRTDSPLAPLTSHLLPPDYQFDSELKEQKLVRSLVKEGMTVFDVGAHAGKYTRLFSLLVGETGRVIAFEPTPDSAKRLASDIQRLELRNVALLQNAVAESSARVTLHQFPEEYSSWNGLGQPRMEDPKRQGQFVPIVGTVEVDAITLNDFCRDQRIERIDYLKLDVEGAELRALQGTGRLLERKAIGFLQFEISRKMLEGLNTTARPVFDYLARHGYECYAIAEDGRLGRKVVDSSSFYENYIALPAAKVASGVRSPPGAARSARLNVSNDPDAVGRSTDSAPGDGRTPTEVDLPIHFFTIVLNGKPFIEHHIKAFEQLPFAWHWHIVEGVAALNHDTAWSKQHGGRIAPTLHRNGLSRDGTTEYLDDLARRFPNNVTLYRKPGGALWDGKLEMVNAPLANIREECLLWQVDADELWTAEQLATARNLFLTHPEKTSAFYFCHYFVGEHLVITTRNTYGNNTGYEWIRTWRFTAGCRWLAHEPPRLCRPIGNGKWADLATIKPFRHAETEAAELVFQHFAYATPEQLEFKQTYYGYAGALRQWRQLQQQRRFPVALKDHFAWVKDGAQVNTAESQRIVPLAAKDKSGAWTFFDSTQDSSISVAPSLSSPSPRPSPPGRGRMVGQSGSNPNASVGPATPSTSTADPSTSLPSNQRFEGAFSLSPREERTGREPERGAIPQKPPLPGPLLPRTSGREGEEAGGPGGFGAQGASTKPTADNVRRILFVRTDAIGDAVLAAPMLPLIRSKYPGAKIAVLGREHVTDLYLACPFVDTVICFDWQKVKDDEQARGEILREIAQFKPDLILNSLYSRESLTELLIHAQQAPQVIGLEGNLSNISARERAEFNRFYTRLLPSPGDVKPELERHRDFLAGLGIEADKLEPQVWTSSEDDALARAFFIEEKLDPACTIALFPGSQHDWKVYPRLAETLRELTGYHFLIFGGSEVTSAAEGLAAQLPGPSSNLCGKTTLREMAALFRKCRLYVGADSAGAHMACAVGLPNVVVLGGGHFGRFLPYSSLTSVACLPLECYGCNWACKFPTVHCVKSLDPIVVAEAIRQTLAASSNKPRVFVQDVCLWPAQANSPRWKSAEPFLAPRGAEIIPVFVDAKKEIAAATTCDRQDADSRLAASLMEAASGFEPRQRVLNIISRLEKDYWLERNLKMYADTTTPWFDAATFLNWFARTFQPKTYLEVGVRRGRSLAQVLVESPATRAVGFDLWIPDYGSVPAQGIHTTNPGSDFVLAELRKLGVTNPPTLIAGDSHQTLPKFFGDSKSPAQFDLIFIDGDHTREGAKLDLDLTFTRLAPGGALVFDDIDNPSHLDLRDLWNEYKAKFPEYLFIEHSHGAGTGVAFRPPFERLHTVVAGKPTQAGKGLGQINLPTTDRQHLELAERCFNAGNLAEAVEHLDRAVEQAPDSVELLTALGNLHFQLGDLPSARLSLRKAVSRRPDDALLHVLLANVCLRLQNVEEFESALGRALQLDPENGPALRLLADLNLQQERFADAARGYAALLRQTPQDIGVLLGLAAAFEGAGDLDTARAACEEALKFQSGNAEAKRMLARLSRAGFQPGPSGSGGESPGTRPTPALISTKPGQAGSLSCIGATEPLVSVIVSAYAAEKYIRACLDDLVAQTIFDQLEIIVIDSGSPQNERVTVEEFQKRYANIRYHRTERETLYAAWNRAIALARGKYIANANCDDAHRPDALEKLAAALETNPEADLAYGDYYTSTVPNDSFAHPNILRHVVHPPYHPATVMMYCVTGCHPMWRKTVFDKLGPFDPTYTAPGDWEFLFRFVQAGLRAVHVPQPLSLFFQNPEGLSWKSAAQSKNENDRILGQYRSQMPIERLYAVDPSDAASASRAWTALGNLAMQHEVPWFSNYVQDLAYSRFCYEQALRADPSNVAAGQNLVVARLLQQRSVGDLSFLEHFPAEVAARLRDDIERGQLQLAPIEAPPAVSPIEFGKRQAPRDVPSGAVLPFVSSESLTSLNLPVRLAASFLHRSGTTGDALNLATSLAGRTDLATFDYCEPYSRDYDEQLPEALRAALLSTRTRFNFCLGGIGISFGDGDNLKRVRDARYHIARTSFAADCLPVEWAKTFNQMDELWVPSRFHAEAFTASGVERDKLVVVPSAVDARLFDPAKHEPLPLPNRAAFNFLAMFEWRTRKGWDALLAAYLREFSAEDDVCLYLRASFPRRSAAASRAAIEQQIREFTRSLNLGGMRLPRIELLAEVPQADLPRLYRAVDCVVVPGRGEAWGRVTLEAMMMGLPVIATHWGAHLDILTADTAYPLDCELVPATGLELDEWQYHGQRWANPSERHLRELMRHVQRNPAEACAKGAKAREQAREQFSTDVVAELMLERVRIIEERLIKPACPPARLRSSTNRQSPSGNRQSLTVALEGSFLDFGSLSQVNRELTRQLAKQDGISLACVAKNVVPPELAHHRALVETARRLKYPAPKNTHVTIRHSWPPNWERPASGKWVLIQPWEFGVLPEEWVQRLEAVDEIWAPSEYVRRVYVESGVDPRKVHVVPNGIDPELFRPDAKPMALATRKKFKFLFVGGTIHRKGPDLLLKAYLETFTAADDVCLVIKDFGGQGVYTGQTFESQIRAAQSRLNAPEILYLNDDLAPDALPGLYTACDCLVHPYRGEGFGLPVLEAMACGRPVIVTGGGSTDDFATDEFSYRIPALRREFGASVSGMKLARAGWMLEPDLKALGEKMKWLAMHRDEARAKGQAASEHVRREWTWERAAQTAALRLQTLAAQDTDESAPPPRSSKPMALPPVARIGHLAQARALFSDGELEAAWKVTAAALETRPFHPEACLLLAEISRAAGDMKRAKQLAEQTRKLAPKWKPAQEFLKAGQASRRTRTGETPVLLSLPDSLRLAPHAPRLSVCLITRNEERLLGHCLESIRDLARQIVVVDTGSTDWTRDIAARYGAEVYSFDWCDDFSAARNAALERATGDWVLFLDADEELLPDQREKLLKLLQDDSAIAFRLPMIDKGREEEGVSYVPRLFRNAPGLFHIGHVHEQLFSSLEVRRLEWGLENKFGDATLLHHGYTKEMVTSRDKIARNLRLLQKALEELPGEPHLLMNLGLELVRAGKLSEGLEQYDDAWRALSALPRTEVVPELRETLLTQFCTHLLSAKRPAEVARVLSSPLAKADGLTATLHWLFGLACIELKQFAEGAEHMRRCLAKRDKPALSPVNKNILKAGPSHCLALCLAALKQTEAADKMFRDALKADPKSKSVSLDYARFLAGNGREVDALRQLHQLIASDPSDATLWLFGGQVAFSKPEFREFACDWTGEAGKVFPAHPGIAEQRAQALLLSGRIEEALPLWRQLAVGANPSPRAALLVCEARLNLPLSPFPAELATRVNQEFVSWYRRLLGANAKKVVSVLNQRIDLLRPVVPAAVRILEAAMAEAGAVSTE